MSPSEADLRAALSDGDGEGAGPNVDVVIATARAQRGRRRTRLLGGLAVAAVVAGLGFGVAQLGGGGSQNSSNGASVAGAAAGGAAHGAAKSPASAPYAGPPGAGTPCPSSAPRYALAGGGSPGQFGSGGALFDKQVSALVVCAYSSGIASGTPARVVLHGSAAQQVVTSVEHAAKQPSTGSCPLYRLAGARQLALIGVAADGTTATAVTAPLGVPSCAARVTNGTAIRYDWSPPAVLVTALGKAAPGGQEHASPIKS